MMKKILSLTSYWILKGRYYWEWLSPTHRWIVGIGVGVGLCLGVWRVLSLSSKTEWVASPEQMGLLAQTPLLESTKINLLLFSFQPIPLDFTNTCSHPVTLQDSHTLSNYQLKHALRQHQFLCWNDLEPLPPNDLTIIKKGHRVLGFALKNAEVLAFLSEGISVDVVLGNNTSSLITLENIRILQFIPNPQHWIVLLEIPSKNIQEIHSFGALISHAQVLLKHPDERTPSPPSASKIPQIQKG